MNRQKINDNWLFAKDDQELYQKKLIGDSVLINLPHTFNQEEIKTDDPIFRGATWYQKKIILQEADLEGELYLEIGAASLQSVVYVNGQQAAVNQTGYAMYRVHLTPYAVVGENLLSIRVTNEKDNTVYPLSGDFTFFGGLYRDVHLIRTRRQHFHLMDDTREGVIVATDKRKEKDYALKINLHIENSASEDKTALLRVRVQSEKKKLLNWEIELADFIMNLAI